MSKKLLSIAAAAMLTFAPVTAFAAEAVPSPSRDNTDTVVPSPNKTTATTTTNKTNSASVNTSSNSNLGWAVAGVAAGAAGVVFLVKARKNVAE
ncbi:MAG: hypothetical protein HUJ54_09880 [Erysipelotrichaceae bacterium]|nr:hypothetical protein [Erysipelotrichaceae bacterium]